jgi:hypothetical protein
MPSKSRRELPETQKYRFPCSIVIREMLVRARAEPSSICNDAGKQIDVNDEHR